MHALRIRLGSSQAFVGWLFVLPVLVGLGLFLFLPMLMAFWISFRDWTGLTPPSQSSFVGLANYRALMLDPGVTRSDFALGLRNNFYYVLGVVPAQTVIAFFLAVVVNQRFLKGKGFFRTAYYFPSITSSIAVSLIFIFLFQRNGAINALIDPLLPTDRINWLDNANGLIHNLLAVVGVHEAPAFLENTRFLGLNLWTWLSGPSMTMYAIMILATWTTIGTLMLIFLAGLQGIPTEVDEASAVDGASAVQRFRFVTLPMMKPTLFFVLTVGLIGTWQVFDQVFAISAGGPQKTTLTPAYLVYRFGFRGSDMGAATAVAFILFVLIIVLTLIQRRVVDPEEA
ncbi:sugar ABC transporter permease [soil metagenome]|jgi:multiple sugar transport system permease protein|nr:sugar ABC transporter permease [Gemmatimonadota bacterium]